MRGFALGLLSLFALSSTALADVPPPKDFVESCTPAVQCTSGEYCSAFHGSADEACSKSMTEAGFELRCKTYGATVSKALFCKKGSATPAPRPTSRAKSGRCSVSDESGSRDGIAILFAAPAIIFSLRRRRK